MCWCVCYSVCGLGGPTLWGGIAVNGESITTACRGACVYKMQKAPGRQHGSSRFACILYYSAAVVCLRQSGRSFNVGLIFWLLFHQGKSNGKQPRKSQQINQTESSTEHISQKQGFSFGNPDGIHVKLQHASIICSCFFARRPDGLPN